MSATILQSETRTAKKVYCCEAYAWFYESGMSRKDLTPNQQLLLDAADSDGGKILPGQQYYYRRGLFEGRMFTWRSRPDMESVCIDHDLYDECE